MPSGAKPKRFIEYKGEKLSIAQAAKKAGLDEYVVRSRYYLGWDGKKIMETPIRQVRKYQQRRRDAHQQDEICGLMRTKDFHACFECEHADCVLWSCVPQQKYEPKILDYVGTNGDGDRRKGSQEIIYKISRPTSVW